MMPQEHTIIRIHDSLQGVQGQLFLTGIPHDKLRVVVSMVEEMKLAALMELQKGTRKVTPTEEQSIQKLFNT